MGITHATAATGSDSGDGKISKNAWNEAHVYPSYETVLTGMSGLVHRWKFEEASGDFADSVGSLTLAVTGSWTYDVTGGPISGSAGSATIETNCYATSSGLGSLPTGSSARTLVVVFKGNASSSQQALFNYGSMATRQWFAMMLNGAATADASGISVYTEDLNPLLTPVNVATWHLAIASYDGGQCVSYSIDGWNTGKRITTAISTATGGNFRVGRDVSGTNQVSAGLTIDDLAAFNRALTVPETQRLFNSFVGT